MGNECSLYNEVLDDIRKKHLNLNGEQVAKNNKLLKNFVDQFIDRMAKESKLFRSCFQNIYYSGSYYDGLRITQPTEYDLNIILRLPFNYLSDLEFELKGNTYCEMSLSKEFHRVMPASHPRYDDYKDMQKYFLDRSVFNADKIHRWFRSLMTKVLNGMSKYLTYETDSIQILYSVKNQGPAHTLIVTRNGGKAFDVDFVPVFEYFNEYFLVPKQPDSFANSNHLWRISYSRKERELLEGKACAKTVIKILKRLRDTQGWEKLESYYIKTAVMHIEGYQNWHPSRLANHLAESAEHLKKFLSDEYLPSLHDPNHNLFGKVRPATLSNYGYRLGRIIGKVRDDPNKLKDYLDHITTEGVEHRGGEITEDAAPADSCSIL